MGDRSRRQEHQWGVSGASSSRGLLEDSGGYCTPVSYGPRGRSSTIMPVLLAFFFWLSFCFPLLAFMSFSSFCVVQSGLCLSFWPLCPAAGHQRLCLSFSSFFLPLWNRCRLRGAGQSLWLHFFVLGNIQLKKLIEIVCDLLGRTAGSTNYDDFIVANCGS